MSLRWLKSYMPRGLYGRGLLILLLPVVTLLLVVSVVFFQRHFEGVTRQMAVTVGREIDLLLADPTATAVALDASEVAQALRFQVSDVPDADRPSGDSYRWHDLTGGVVVRELKQRLPEVVAVELPDHALVWLYMRRADGIVRLSFDRRRISASNPHQLLVNMLVFGGLMTVVSFLYLRNQLRPITRLATAAEACGLSGLGCHRGARSRECFPGHACPD